MNSKTPNVPENRWPDIGKTDHFVKFYKEDDALIRSVTEFFRQSLREGNTSVIIATKAHCKAVESELHNSGINVDALRVAEKYLDFDAAEILARFMADGFPDERLFNATLGAILARATQNGRAVRAFGEMVALLWMDGNQKAAVRLEELWNQLAQSYSFCLFCAYPLATVQGGANAARLAHVCGQHSHVIWDGDHFLS